MPSCDGSNCGACSGACNCECRIEYRTDTSEILRKEREINELKRIIVELQKELKEKEEK